MGGRDGGGERGREEDRRPFYLRFYFVLDTYITKLGDLDINLGDGRVIVIWMMWCLPKRLNSYLSSSPFTTHIFCLSQSS